jgi:glutathione-independent formaldehyde dehydrogenase
MPSNRGVVYLGPGKVQVQDIDFPTFHNPAGKAIDHGVILKAVATNV